MYIRNIGIDNVHCFGTDAYRVDIDLARPDGLFAGWTVFVGPNGFGKTTLLKAIALAVACRSEAGNLEPGFASWIRRGAEWAYVGMELDVPLTDGFLGGGGNVAGGAEPFWAGLRVGKAFREDPEPVLRPYERSLDVFWLKDESLESSEKLPELDKLAAEIVEDLRAALAQFEEVAGDLAG